MAKREKAEVQPPESKPEEGQTPVVEPPEEQKVDNTAQILDELRGKLQKQEQDYKALKGIISKKDDEIQSLKDDRELWKAMIGAIAEQTGRTEADVEQDIQTRKPNLTQQFAQIEQRQQQRRFAEKVNSYQQMVEQELGLKAGDDDYDAIQGFVMAGKFDKADKKIEAIKAKQTEAKEVPKPTEEKPKESEEELRTRLEREILEKHGLLKSETGEPSASGGKLTAEMVANMSPDERFERRAEIAKIPLGLEGKGKEK